MFISKYASLSELLKQKAVITMSFLCTHAVFEDKGRKQQVETIILSFRIHWTAVFDSEIFCLGKTKCLPDLLYFVGMISVMQNNDVPCFIL